MTPTVERYEVETADSKSDKVVRITSKRRAATGRAPTFREAERMAWAAWDARNTSRKTRSWRWDNHGKRTR